MTVSRKKYSSSLQVCKCALAVKHFGFPFMNSHHCEIMLALLLNIQNLQIWILILSGYDSRNLLQDWCCNFVAYFRKIWNLQGHFFRCKTYVCLEMMSIVSKQYIYCFNETIRLELDSIANYLVNQNSQLWCQTIKQIYE